MNNAILAARPLGSGRPAAPPPALGGAGIPRPGAVRTAILPSALAAARPIAPAAGAAPVLPPAEDPAKRGRGRPSKEEKMREARRAMNSRIAAFADSKPSKKAVREFFMARIGELNDEML